ncbi:GRIP and coiled-coil domain-containing protein 2 [Drosophila obscura]|uniref:GRIP and coiled-coil domain-containing protein 2 n=1 Tax=Drosophila obscura TaxID=7282 RepID=UPI001BB19013|nr:GRIP and coiled-coil domain-containing protein 2 [Drosophila obscura]
MQNLIQSPALLSILKYPLPNFHNPVKSVEERDAGVKSVGSGVFPLNANACVFVPRSVAVKADEDIAPVDLEQLKRHFESKDVKQQKTKLTLPWKGFPKRPDKAANPTHVTAKINEDYAFEIKSGGKRAKREIASAEEKPKKVPAEEAKTEAVTVASVDLTLEEKRLEHGRKIALEALKLVEQRRLRGPFVDPSKKAEAGEVIRHISHSPVRFTPEERVRVDKLRAAKKERIERVLKEMTQKKKKPLQQKPQKEKTYQEKCQNEPTLNQVMKIDSDQLQKDIQFEIFKLNQLNEALKQEKLHNEMMQEKMLKRESLQQEMCQQVQQEKPPPQRMIQKRYFGLQRATAIINPQLKTAVDPVVQSEVKIEVKPEVKTEPKLEVNTEAKSEPVANLPARRYIPTTKEWDEKCRTRQLERLKASDKENDKSKSNPNATLTANKPVLWRADSNRPLTVSNSAKNLPEMIKFENPTVAVVIPRYIPPIPIVETADCVLARLLQTEKRRGNLTYAQALLSRPPVQFEPSSESYPLDNIIRYTAEELLMLEPQPEQLQTPILLGTSTGLGCLFE